MVGADADVLALRAAACSDAWEFQKMPGCVAPGRHALDSLRLACAPGPVIRAASGPDLFSAAVDAGGKLCALTGAESATLSGDDDD